MFDPFTLVFTVAITHLLTSAVLGAAWYVDRSVPGIGEWAAGRQFVALSMVFFMLRPVVPLVVSTVLGNGFLFVGLYIILRGNQKFMNRRLFPLVPVILVAVLLMVAVAYWTVIEQNYPMRVALSSAMILSFYVISFGALWPRDGDESFFCR